MKVIKFLVCVLLFPIWIIFWILHFILGILDLFTLHTLYPILWLVSGILALITMPLEWATGKVLIPRDDRDNDRYF